MLNVIDTGLTGNSKYDGLVLHVEYSTMVEIPENGIVRREPSGTQWRQASVADYNTLVSMLLAEADKPAKPAGENSGGNVNYYRVYVERPQRKEQSPYWAECGDIIRFLDMNFDEGTVFKSLWRSCAERTLGLKKAGGDSVRDAEKMVHSSQLVLGDRKAARAKLSPSVGISFTGPGVSNAPTFSNIGKVSTVPLSDKHAPLVGGTNIDAAQGNTAIGSVSFQVGDADAN